MLKHLFLLFLPLLEGALPPAKCRCRPSDPCWPSDVEWQQLNRTTNSKLQLLKPVGIVCHGSQYDVGACDIVRSQQHNSSWRADHPAATHWPNWEMWPEKGETCYIEGEKSALCGQGRVSIYSITAESPEDIQAAVRFAGKHDLRVAVRNTGHDFAGRSVAPESLQINTHLMKDMKKHENFKIGTCNGIGRGLAVTVGAGVQLYEMYKWLGDEGLMVVGGSSHGVGIAGGYIQGGGHSLFAASNGMASDNALEFTVVTADGEHVTANDCHNSDLFWALRGGGGGTWGVVTSATVRAFDDPPIVTFSLTGSAAKEENYWTAVERIHEFLPEFNDAGGSMYYYIIPDLPNPSPGKISSFTAAGAFSNVSHKDAVDKLLEPLVEELGIIAETPFNYTSALVQKASSSYVAANEAPDAVGEFAILGSRIITRDFLRSAEGPRKLTSAIRSLRTYPGDTALGQNAIQGLVVGGPAVMANAGKIDSALHPVWRKGLLHLVIARGWSSDTPIAEQHEIQRNLTKVEVPILKNIDSTPGGGAYLNEADGYEENFQDSFWGINYPRLYEIKMKWDPQGLFIVRRGVGSEDWNAEGMCRL